MSPIPKRRRRRGGKPSWQKVGPLLQTRRLKVVHSLKDSRARGLPRRLRPLLQPPSLSNHSRVQTRRELRLSHKVHSTARVQTRRLRIRIKEVRSRELRLSHKVHSTARIQTHRLREEHSRELRFAFF